MNAKYLQCDAPHCDHVEFHDKVTKDLVGKPCPACGSNLLTERDWRAARRVERVLAVFRFFGLVRDWRPGMEPRAGERLTHIHTYNGKTTIKEIDQ